MDDGTITRFLASLRVVRTVLLEEDERDEENVVKRLAGGRQSTHKPSPDQTVLPDEPRNIQSLPSGEDGR